MESSRYYLETTFPPDGSSVHHTAHCPGHKTTTTVWTTTRVIGRGANGTVVLQTGPSGLVRAVKQVFNSYSYTKEVAALSKVSDRRDLFVQFFGWYEDKDYLYIAMEFVADGDLGAYLKACGSSPPPEETCKAISRQLLEALKVLHERQICHRDLKPQNILVAALDPIRVKITDFGASKILLGTECRTRIGTSGYVAPEILGVWSPPRGRRPFFGPAVDLWAAGCVIHELLSLQLPFTRKLPDPDPDEMMDGISGLDCHQEPIGTDMVQLMGYCQAQLPLPVEALAQSGASMEAVEVVRALLMADPESRATAPEALRYSWLSESRRPLALGADTGLAELYAPDSHQTDLYLDHLGPPPEPLFGLYPYKAMALRTFKYARYPADTVVLSFLDQDILEILDASSSLAWWSARNEAGDRGWVPSIYFITISSPAATISSLAATTGSPAPITISSPAATIGSPSPITISSPAGDRSGFYCMYPGCTRSQPFKYLSELKNHIRKHQPASIQCPECKQMFKQERIMKKHLLRIHKPDFNTRIPRSESLAPPASSSYHDGEGQ